MSTTLEAFTTAVNAAVFLREFTFSRNQFYPTPGAEKEFADNVLWLEDSLVVFQIKERSVKGDPSEDASLKWFDDEVKKEAARQIRETLSYLKENERIVLTNERGHAFDVRTGDFREIHKIILYGSQHPLPTRCDSEKSHISKSTGDRLFFHIISADDHALVCRVLQTPVEVIKYLRFREEHLQTVLDARHQSEKSLLGRFLMSPAPNLLDLDGKRHDFSDAVDNLEDDEDEWNIRWLFENMFKKAWPEKLGNEKLKACRKIIPGSTSYDNPSLPTLSIPVVCTLAPVPVKSL